MNMNMSGSDGILSIPAEHLPGLYALVALPIVAWLAVRLVHWLSARGFAPAVALDRWLLRASAFERLALFALVTGAAVHLAVVPTHWGDERVLASLFVVDAVGLLAAAALLLTRNRIGRLAAIAMLGGTAGAYAWYLLTGWESADLVGLLTTAVELAGALLLLVPAASPGPARHPRQWTASAAVVSLVALLGTAAIAGVPATDTVASASTGTPISLVTDSPAGAIAWPVSMPSDMQGMSMATPGCAARPTTAQQRAAVDLVDRTTAAVAPYRSLAAARAAGYVPVTPTGRKVVHYINFSVARQGDALDPQSIPVLVYVNTAHGAVLSAAMYLDTGQSAGDPPQPGGCLMQWHTHTNLCFRGGSVVGSDARGSCSSGSVNRTTQPMMHVWMVPVPGGPLAPDPGPVSEVVAAAQLPPLTTPNGVA
jgi:hypothetical protein